MHRHHVFTPSKYEVVRLEELDSVARLRADAIAVYQPVNSQELFAIERIAIAQQSLLRCAGMEAGFHTLGMGDSLYDGAPLSRIQVDLAHGLEVSCSQNRSLCAAYGFEQVHKRGDAWRLFLRYQAQTERLYRRALEDFERLKAVRKELPNEATAPILHPAFPPADGLPNEPIASEAGASAFCILHSAFPPPSGPNQAIAEPEVITTPPTEFIDVPRPDPEGYLRVGSVVREKLKYPPQPPNPAAGEPTPLH